MIKINGSVVNFETFPNDEVRLELDPILHVGNKMANVLFKWENDSDFMKLLYLKKELDRYCHRVDLVITYMPYSRMDRTEGKFAFTLKWVCDFINDLKFDSVIVIDAHSDVTCALLNNSENYIIVKYLFDSIKFGHAEKIIIYFPDGGAYKKYEKYFNQNYDIVFGNKIRDFKTGKITKLDIVGDIPENSHVVMVDDLCSFGGTFVMSADKIMENYKPRQIDLVVGHCEKSIIHGKIFSHSHITNVYTTDSIISEDYTNIDQLHIRKVSYGLYS